jgi:hypothetical protein
MGDKKDKSQDKRIQDLEDQVDHLTSTVRLMAGGAHVHPEEV